MELEQGKFYLTKCGHLVQIFETPKKSAWKQGFDGAYIDVTTFKRTLWTWDKNTGKSNFFGEGPSELDVEVQVSRSWVHSTLGLF